MKPARSTRHRSYSLFFFMAFLLVSISGAAQYFGKNKVLYRNFDFSVLQSPHFEIYNYLESESAKNRIAVLAEQWYEMHRSLLKDSFRHRNPIIVYDNHAHFQLTRAVEGPIDVGTGGVTDALKNRIIMPFLESNAQTDHVIGHEMVHVFQYHLVKDSVSINALNNLPLWMVEGLAEYMSTGFVDANTALWLRSAVLHDKLPTLRDLTFHPNIYFPYRWGQAFWTYFTALYGDGMIRRFFVLSAKKGYVNALKILLKTDDRTFSLRWQQAIRKEFLPYEKTTRLHPAGNSLVGLQNGGRLNIVPSISPDGRYLAFWTEKNLFSLDLYIADACTGKMIKRITTHSLNAHIDQYSSYESSVAWSPDSREIAFVAFAKGHNRLIIADREGKVKEEIDIADLPAFSNPAWAPDGRSIVLTGLSQGQSDLYQFDLSTRELKQLTHDMYSDLLPSFSPDGNWIAFASDRVCLMKAQTVHRFSHNISLLNLSSGEIVDLDLFPGANNLNPVFGSDNKTIWFLSDQDGFRNLYSYDITDRQIFQRTNLFTGISGITMYAPAISLARETDQMVYTYYNDGAYSIQTTNIDSLEKTPVNASVINMKAAMIPPVGRKSTGLIQEGIDDPENLPVRDINTRTVDYKPRLGLDYVGGSSGMQTGGLYGTGMAGGMNALFGDMVGDHQLFAGLSLNGEIVDVAGQFAYVNQKHRFNWGLSVSHIPYLSGAQYASRDIYVNEKGDSVPAINYSTYLLRTFEDQVAFFASYPFSSRTRIEAGASFSRYYYRLDKYTEYYDQTGNYLLSTNKEKEPVPDGFNLGQSYLAFVGDNASFGVASPLIGHRFRLEWGRYIGSLNMNSLQLDYRRYFRIKPFTVAIRDIFSGRYGSNASNGLLPPLFIGYPSFIRGYDALQYADNGSSSRLAINDLIGSKIFVSNFEIRFPLTGPERLSAIKSRFFFTELNLFTDGGIAWGKTSFVRGTTDIPVDKNSKLIISTGLSLRINLFGFLVIEPFYAVPWQNGGWHKRSLGLNILPGW